MATPLPAYAAVVGGGRMGTGIAHALLTSGCRVLLVDADDQAAAAAQTRVTELVARSVDRGSVQAPAQKILADFAVTGSIRDDVAAADLVIEAVPEQVAIKVQVLGDLSATLTSSAVIATNTSSISINELAAVVDSPERFLGLHFFNPVPSSALVEVVTGHATDADVTNRSADWVGAMGKTPILVRDSPGFASSRLGVGLGLEAVRMVEERVAPAADIDSAMTLGYKHPVGPLRLTDIVGLDVRLGIAEYLVAALGSRFEPPQLLRDLVDKGDLGRKTGRGFYEW